MKLYADLHIFMKQPIARFLIRPEFLLTLIAAAWLGNALYAFGVSGGLVKYYSPAIVAVAMIAFVLLHGVQRYGKRLIGQFVLTVFTIGWTFETISIVTGIPFGTYHYTEIMAPFLGHVPVFVLPAYGVMGYASWSLATLILGQRGAGLDRVGLVLVPILAALLMVFWDLSMDHLRASVEGRWVWAEGGAHYGIPWMNYLGWMLVTWLMFQIFAVLVARANLPEVDDKPLMWWCTIPLIYLSFAVEYVLNPITGNGIGSAVLMSGQTISVQAVFVNVAVLTLITMVPMAALGIICARFPNLLGRLTVRRTLDA